MMRDIINSFIWSGCTDFAGLALSVGKLVGVYLIGCVATYCPVSYTHLDVYKRQVQGLSSSRPAAGSS